MCEEALTKTCSTCHKTKPIGEFRKADNKSGLRANCKQCDLETGRAYTERNKNRGTTVPELKICPKCKTEKPALAFDKNGGKKDGLASCCKECASKSHKVSSKKNSSRETIIIPNIKTCVGCDSDKASSAFDKCSRDKDGLQVYCKECRYFKDKEEKYGATKRWIEDTLTAQGGGCGICKNLKPGGRGRFHVDHWHLTDGLRGMLCNGCNLGLGHLRDSVEIMAKAIEYLLSGNLGIEYKVNWRKTGVPEGIRNRILANQYYKCKICSVDLRRETACIDHCHKTLWVRGALCRFCNSGLGYFKDSIPILRSAIEYLTKYKK